MNTGKVVLGIVAGAATGALLGVLFAPHKGKITRKKISRGTGHYADEVKIKFNDFLDTMTEKFDKVKEDISEFADEKMAKVEEVKKNMKAV
jgi:gas vesicle protein